MDLHHAYRWICGDFKGRDGRCLEQNEECSTMTESKITPLTIDDVIEKLNDFKSVHGNVEVRSYEGRYTQYPDFETYPKFCVLPADQGIGKILVIL
jgi:hypothetical protein